VQVLFALRFVVAFALAQHKDVRDDAVGKAVREGGVRLAPDYVIRIFEAGALEKEDVVRGDWVPEWLVDCLADVHAYVAAIFQNAMALPEGKLQLPDVVMETFGRALGLEQGRAGYNELHGIGRHFGHAARVADYNEVFLFHAHIEGAGV